ncbi:FAD-binding protein [Pseudoclavibacter sp. VKM Ac-2867]|nr:FAD-binding protein [Pseudoclavibacter sp. VKM Ac-2867]MBF4458094.1 FAD-binding protein [Pseudoclavibacter sp. VKM Ac-2867]
MTRNSPEQRRLNWAGSLTYSARAIVEPRSIDETAGIVAESDRVHALGTRHSFSDVADSSGVLVVLGGLNADLVIDAPAMTVTLSAGATYGEVAPEIDRAGFALHNEGSLPHISVGGAVATGTHGSGTALGSLSTAVRALEFLGPDGSLRTIERHSADFNGAVLNLGLLGIVTRVTLDIQPRYSMRQDAYGPMPWRVYLENLDQVHRAGYSVSAFTTFDDAVSEVLVKSRVPESADDIDVEDDLFGSPRLPGEPDSETVTARDGSVGPWWDRLPHFPIGSAPSVGSELQSEHFVPLRHAGAALEAIRAHSARLQPLLHVCELRTMAGDELWLSPTQGEDVLCVAFTWKKLAAPVLELLSVIERSLSPFEARPHWGKLTSLDRDEFNHLYPRLPSFRRLVSEADADRKFVSPFSERLLDI